MTCATMCSIDSTGSGIPSFSNRWLHCSIISPTVRRCAFTVHRNRAGRFIALILLKYVHVSTFAIEKRIRTLDKLRHNIVLHEISLSTFIENRNLKLFHTTSKNISPHSSMMYRNSKSKLLPSL